MTAAKIPSLEHRGSPRGRHPIVFISEIHERPKGDEFFYNYDTATAALRKLKMLTAVL